MHTSLSIPKVEFSDFVLENGLRVILHRNPGPPLVHVSLHYRVGSSYETPGKSGLAHLFEHMMFQGSDLVEKNEHGRLIDEAGGRWNASTSKDRTNYYNTVPSHYLELALWLEADRMRSLKVTEENFENQRQTVIEEKKQSYDNRPYGTSFLRFDELAYENWAYGHPIIGSEEDLIESDLEHAVDFHRTFYGPGNAVLVLAGDIEPEHAGQLIEKYFCEIEDQTRAEPPNLKEPIQRREKSETISDPLAVLPAVAFGFQMPAMDTPEYYTLSMLALLLADGDSSRLYQKFVYDNNWITGLFAGPNQYRGPEIFRIWFQVQKGVGVDRIVEEVEKELHRFASEKVTEDELQKAKTQISYQFVSRLLKISRVGELLAQYASLLDQPELVNSQWEKYLAVTPEEVREAAADTFQRNRRTLLITEPGDVS